MARIWLNHWFSTAYNIIELIKKGDSSHYIIGTNANEYAVYGAVCDEFYKEPVLKDDEYVEFCLEFCREHKIDVFMPRRGMLPISRNKSRFEEAGVKVMVDDYDKVSLLNDKSKAYGLFRDMGIGRVPEHIIVTNAQQFREAYEKLEAEYGQVCFKFVRDEGGMSFRLIDNSRKGYAALFRMSAARIHFDDAFAALSEREEFSPLMVMPYLPDEEASVDCLRTPHGVIMLPRLKNASRVEKMFFDEEILTACRDFFDKFGLDMPCNIQFKYFKGKPYFLEVNTRMSGGVQMSCLGGGVNIPYIAVSKLLGKDIPWKTEKSDRRVSYVEIPLIR